MTVPAAPATAGAAMRPSPVPQRTSRPECAHGRAPTVRQLETCECTGAKSAAAQKPATAGPPPGGSSQQAVPPPCAVRPRRPEPCRQPHAGAGRATCRLPPRRQTARLMSSRLEAMGWSGHRQNCVDGYVFDRRKVPRHGSRVRPHMYRAAVILVSPGCTCTHNPVGSEAPGGPAGGARQAAR